MQQGVELKYIILFAILIALTGFTFETQIDNPISKQHADDTSTTTLQARR